jgi:hypothetical protein
MEADVWRMRAFMKPKQPEGPGNDAPEMVHATNQVRHGMAEVAARLNPAFTVY